VHQYNYKVYDIIIYIVSYFITGTNAGNRSRTVDD